MNAVRPNVVTRQQQKARSVVLFMMSEISLVGIIVLLNRSVSSVFTGASSIPSGSLTLKDGLAILKIVAKNPDAIFTFTNTIILSKKVSHN